MIEKFYVKELYIRMLGKRTTFPGISLSQLEQCNCIKNCKNKIDTDYSSLKLAISDFFSVKILLGKVPMNGHVEQIPL